MTTLSLNFRQAAYAQETGRVLICLLTLTHEDLTEPIRLSTDPTQRIAEYTTDTEVVYGTVSRGNTYLFLPMRIRLPNESDEGPGEMTIEIDNVHRTYTETIRSLVTPVICNTEIVMDNALDTVEVQWPEFAINNIKYNSTTITGTLKLELLEREPFPAGTFTPAYFPGLF